MLRDYAPILVLLALVLGFAVASLLLSKVLGGHRGTIDKTTAYECGMRVQGTTRVRLSIHFYLVAVLFILFDVESLLILPWAVSARRFTELGIGGTVFAEIALFAAVLGLGLAYVWRKGGLTWDR